MNTQLSLSIVESAICLSDEFLAKYPNFPAHMTALGKFVYYRTYSRWLPDLKRRETWKETCIRAVQYNIRLGNAKAFEAEELFDNMFNLRQFLSGRTLWVGDTTVAEKFPTANFNCSGVVIKSLEAFKDLFYLLLVGTGVGFRVLKTDVMLLPKFRQDVKLIHIPYTPRKPEMRVQDTYMEVLPRKSVTGYKGKSATIVVGDSKEGWVDALYDYLLLMTEHEYRHIEEITVLYNSVRPKGERLKTFGGTASGHESLRNMFLKIHNVLTTDLYAPRPVNGWLRPIHALDIANIISENVVVGGVRRASGIALIDPNDEETMTAKVNITPEKAHRYMSNNSVFYTKKPTREQLQKHFAIMRANGEPGFCNAEEALKRNPKFALPNPCFEALLSDKGLCNLTTTNIKGFVKNGVLDVEALLRAHKLGGRAGLRMTLVNLELPDWDEVQKEQRMLGVSLTGWYDAIDEIGYTEEQEIELMKLMKDAVTSEVNAYADELGIPHPVLITLVKPEGTLSQVAGGVSQGVHRSHSEDYIRRIRINAHDPLLKTVEALGWDVANENDQGITDPATGEYIPVSTKVVSFPVHSGAKTTKYDVTALDQLKTYYNFQKYYTQGNTSITVTVRPSEWDGVEQSIWDNWENFVGVSFLELGTKSYRQMPYEAISREEYEHRSQQRMELNIDLLNAFELELENAGDDLDASDSECASGACPIR